MCAECGNDLAWNLYHDRMGAKTKRMQKVGRKAEWKALPRQAREFVERLIKEVDPLLVYYFGKNKHMLYDAWGNAVYEFIVVVEDQFREEKGLKVAEIVEEIDKKYPTPLDVTWTVGAVTVEMSAIKAAMEFTYKKPSDLYASWALRYGKLIYKRPQGLPDTIQRIGHAYQYLLSQDLNDWLRAAQCWLDAAKVQMNTCPVQAGSAIFMCGELIVKGMLIKAGYSEEQLITIGHNIELMKRAVKKVYSGDAHDGLVKVIKTISKFAVVDRYPYIKEIDISEIENALVILESVIRKLRKEL